MARNTVFYLFKSNCLTPSAQLFKRSGNPQSLLAFLPFQKHPVPKVLPNANPGGWHDTAYLLKHPWHPAPRRVYGGPALLGTQQSWTRFRALRLTVLFWASCVHTTLPQPRNTALDASAQSQSPVSCATFGHIQILDILPYSLSLASHTLLLPYKLEPLVPYLLQP